MASEVDIINDALIRVGAETITSRTDGSNNANVADKIFDNHRDKLLRRHTWNFNTKRVKLARSSNTPPFGYDYQYPLPTDFLRVIEVSDNTDGTGILRYKIEYDNTDTRVIVTSSTDVYLRYGAKITDTGQMDPDLIDCLSLSLATVFAIKIAQSNTLYRDIREEFISALRAARSVDGQEDFPDQIPAGSWISSRYSGVDGCTDASS